MPLAVQMMSGTTPSSSHANRWPVRANPVCTSSAMKTMPLALAYSTRAGMKPRAGSMKPPSPWIGSITMAATFSAPICLLIMSMACAAASSAQFSGPVGHRKGYAMGIRYTSGAYGPKRCLYGMFFAVSVMVSSVRPW